MDAYLRPELSEETWVAATLLEGLTADLLPAGSDIDIIVSSRRDATLTTVREWVQSGEIPTWSEITVLAITDWQSVCRYGGEIMAASGSSVGSFSAGCSSPGASGYDSQIS